MILNFIKKNKLLSLIIFLGFICHFLISFPSGSYYCFNNQCGLYFWGAHEHDAIWHLAVINTAFKTWPPRHPIFVGANLAGYNYFLDFVIFLLAKTGVSTIIWYFKILPIVWLFIYTYLSLKLSEKIMKSYWFKVFFVFFNYFGASFGVFFTLFHKKTIWGASSMLSMQSLLSLVNPQFAFSLIIILLSLLNFFEKKYKKKILLYMIYAFVNFGLKFYAGVISLFLITFLVLIDEKKLIEKFIILILINLFALLSIIIFYQPLSIQKTGFPLIFSPFSMVHSMIEEKDLFYLPKVVNARYYLYQFGVGPRLLTIELFSTLLFLIFNFGVRFLGLVYFLINFLKRKFNLFFLSIFITIIFSVSLTIFFIQKGIWWNTIQFTYYGLFLGNILISLFLTRLIEKRNSVLTILAIVLVFLNIPENIDILKSFIPLKPGSYIDKEEIEALNFLKTQPNGVVLSPNANNKSKRINNNIETAFIPAFSGKTTFLSNTLQLIVTGVNYEKRLKWIEKDDCSILNKINYIYINRQNDTSLKKISGCNKPLIKVFENKKVKIFKI